MTHQEAIKILDKIIGTPAPIKEAESLRKQVAVTGEEDSQIPPELEEAVKNLQKQGKRPAKKKGK